MFGVISDVCSVGLYERLPAHHHQPDRGARELPLPTRHAGLPGERVPQPAQQIAVGKHGAQPHRGGCLTVPPQAGTSSAKYTRDKSSSCFRKKQNVSFKQRKYFKGLFSPWGHYLMYKL